MPILGEFAALKGEYNSHGAWSCKGAEQVLGSQKEGVYSYPGREILWRTFKLMPGGLKGFKQESQGGAVLAEGAQGQRPRGKKESWSISQNGWKEALVGGGKR